MQSYIRAFLSLFRGQNTAPPLAISPHSPFTGSAPETPESRAPHNGKTVGNSFDMDKCYEVGFNSVQKTTDELMNALRVKREYTSATSRLDLITRWDTLIEDMLVKDISAHYPDHEFITEDKVHFRTRPAVSLTDSPTWFIDPIDGTMNFVHGFPYAAISVAFWMNKQPEFGIIWNPLLDQCYTSRRGLGSYMNVRPLKVSTHTRLSNALVMHELGSDTMSQKQQQRNINKIWKTAHALRCLGSTPLSMCMVAQGYADAYFEFGCHAWDVAAAMLIVKEAGGVVCDPSMKPLDLMSRKVLCASTQTLAEELSAVLTQMSHLHRDDKAYSSLKSSERTLPLKTPLRSRRYTGQVGIKIANGQDFSGSSKFRGVPKKRPKKPLEIETTSDPPLPGQQCEL